MSKLYDVIAVNTATRRLRILDKYKSPKNAIAVVKMAVIRRGVETEFYVAVPADKYSEGDLWEGKK